MTLKRTLPLALVILALGATAGLAQTAKKPAPKPPAASEPAQPQQSQLESKQDWVAFIYKENGATVCYARSEPKKKEPETAKRDPVYFFITNRPSQNVHNEISIGMGYPEKEDGAFALKIGGQSFKLFPKDTFAWVADTADEPRIIAAMKVGKDAVVDGTSKRGTKTTDTYSLDGLKPVLAAMDKKCK